jgi:hypothetical protein
MAAARPKSWEAMVDGARLARGRLARRSFALVAALALVVPISYAFVARHGAPLDAPGRSLALVLGYVVPLAAFAVVSLCLGGARLDDSVWSIARHGTPRRLVALGECCAAIAVVSALSAACTAAALAAAYGGSPGLGADVLTSAWIAALGAAAYAAWFSLGAAFLRLGRGRWVPLVGDFVLGGTAGPLAIVWPRGHLDNLAGGAAPLALSQPSSSVALAGMAIVGLCLAAMRAGE